MFLWFWFSFIGLMISLFVFTIIYNLKHPEQAHESLRKLGNSDDGLNEIFESMDRDFDEISGFDIGAFNTDE